MRYIIREILTTPVMIAAPELLIARCAGHEAYFKVLQDFMRSRAFILTGDDPRSAIVAVAIRAGLTSDQVDTCVADAPALGMLNDRAQAALAAGVESTPTFVVNGRMLKPGALLGGRRYEGGELDRAQFDAAFRVALARSADQQPAQRAHAHPSRVTGH